MNEALGNKKLRNFSKTLKSDIGSINSKLETQSLILEAITSEGLKNTELMQEGTAKFTKTIYKLKNDPRNFLILFLVLLCVSLFYYLTI